MAPRRNIIAQDNFAAGSYAVGAGYLIPPDAALQIENGLLDDQGLIYKRGGATYRSEAPFGSSGLTFLWDGVMSVGRRTVIANNSDFGVLDGDDEPVNLGGAGVPVPGQAAYVAGLLFLPGGYIYGGSLLDSAHNATVEVTEDSTTVTTASGFTGNVDPGMLMQIGDERVYVVKSVTSDTSLELTEPYAGSSDSSAAATFHPLYTIDPDDPYPSSEGYSVCVGRLLTWEGSTLRFSGVNQPHSWGEFDYHETPGEIITGVGVIQQDVLVFTDQGTWTLSNLAFNIVDPQGNPQHRFAILSRDLVLWHGAGIGAWDQALVVPCIDAIWLLDGVSSPARLSRAIDRRYRDYVRRGYVPGKPAVYQGTLLLPILTTNGTAKDLLVCRLDAPSGDEEEGPIFPWCWFSGQGGKVAALALDTTESDAPRLLAAETGDTSRVLDMTSVFSPNATVATDPDGTVPRFVLDTRVWPTGDGTKNQVRSVRTRYTLRSQSGDAEINIAWAEDRVVTNDPKWGAVKWGQFKWGGGKQVLKGLECPLPEGEAAVHRCRVNGFARFIRLRYECSDPVTALAINGIEIAVRPSRATRR